MFVRKAIIHLSSFISHRAINHAVISIKKRPFGGNLWQYLTRCSLWHIIWDESGRVSRSAMDVSTCAERSECVGKAFLVVCMPCTTTYRLRPTPEIALSHCVTFAASLPYAGTQKQVFSINGLLQHTPVCSYWAFELRSTPDGDWIELHSTPDEDWIELHTTPNGGWIECRGKGSTSAACGRAK